MKTLQDYVNEDYSQRGYGFTENGTYHGIDAFVQLIKENLKPNIKVAELGVFDGATTREALPIVPK